MSNLARLTKHFVVLFICLFGFVNRQGHAAEPSLPSMVTHVLAAETAYYITGPQQGRAPDGKFRAGTKVRVMREAGSYALVQAENGVTAYVSSDALGETEGGVPVELSEEVRAVVHSMPTRNLFALLHRFHSISAVQYALGLGSFQTSLTNHVEKCLAITDVLAVNEIRPEQRLHDRLLNARLFSQPDQPVGIECVRRAFDLVKGEVDAFLLAHRNYPCVEFQ